MRAINIPAEIHIVVKTNYEASSYDHRMAFMCSVIYLLDATLFDICKYVPRNIDLSVLLCRLLTLGEDTCLKNTPSKKWSEKSQLFLLVETLKV